MTTDNTVPPLPHPGLPLLIRLRWLALAGQLGLCLFASTALQMVLPWQVLAPCMAITALTNIVAGLLNKRSVLRESAACGSLLVLDTLTLTLMLYWTGGAHNAFATFYLLHIAIATILLSYRMAWGMVLLGGLCYALLFTSAHTLHSLSEHEFCGSFDFHLQGMLVSMVLVGMGIVFFAGKLKIALARKEAELQRVRQGAARNERFASLATLAAGVAHELATPLGTIAIASEDLEEQAAHGCFSQSCHKDAILIRSEVQRCRDVIEKLRQQTTDGIGDPLQELAVEAIPHLLQSHLKREYWQRLASDNRCKAKTISVPKTALLQSLAALVANAAQATPRAEPVRLTITARPGAIDFTVSDSGNGMTPATLARLGEPFFTTKEPGGGMGLGLFLVRMFVERINGDLNIDSGPGGTRITLTIPANENPVD